MKKLAALIAITRPANVLIAALSVLLAAGLVHPNVFRVSVLCAVFSVMLITAGANAVNDLCDVEIDRINKPQRVLPAGRLSLVAARWWAIILLVCGVVFSIFINLSAVLIAASSSLILVAYSRWLKRKPLIGNLTVSFITALTFIYGALAASASVAARPESSLPFGDWRAGLFPAVFSFLFHFGREVIKDIEDQAGDRAANAMTLPLAWGLRPAQIAASVAFALLATLVFLPYVIGIYRRLYLVTILIGVLPVLVYAAIQIWRQPEAPVMRRTSTILKFDMLAGMLAIYLGSYF